MDKEDKFKSWLNSPKGQKITFGGLSIFGLVIILLGFSIIKFNIKSPFLGHQGWEDSQQAEQAQKVAELINKDTDKDGLSDFDELYVHNTSPYLEDTDSDGFLDKQEIETGNDPLCPVGKECGFLGSEGVEGSVEGKTIEKILPTIGQGETTGTQEMSIQEIRRILEEAGITPDILNTIDDQTLQEIYQETIKETGTDIPSGSEQGIINQPTDSSLSPNISPDLLSESITIDEIRQLLISSGMDEKMLNSIDDETLQNIFWESME